MDNPSVFSSLTALSPYFTPATPSELVALHKSVSPDDLSKNTTTHTGAEATYSAYWVRFSPVLALAVKGDDRVLLQSALTEALDLINTKQVHSGFVQKVIVDALAEPGSFTVEKAEWIEAQGFRLRPTPQSPLDIHQSWACAADQAAFDWALSSMTIEPDSSHRTQALCRWLDDITTIASANSSIAGVFEFEFFSYRFNAIEDVRPGIVREWVSALPGYERNTTTNANANRLSSSEAQRANLRTYLEKSLRRGLIANQPHYLVDWLDPGRYGTPRSVNVLFEAAVSFSHDNGHPGQMETAWANLARALEQRDEALLFWKKQSKATRLVHINPDYRPMTSSFPSQSLVFGDLVIGREYYNQNKVNSPHWDAKLPLDPLGRILGGTNNQMVSDMANTPQGRAQIVGVMMSHPAFMMYGFGTFGAELLAWDEAKALDGFRDQHGFGAARYALAQNTCVTSTFDVALHRYLRQRKPLCDDASPKLDTLFIDEAAKSKYWAMELKKLSRNTQKDAQINRPSVQASSFKM